MPFPILILLISTGAAWFMCGLIWFVQIVHYPQFSDVPVAQFCAYHRRHTRLTTFVVAGPMLIEMASAVWLVIAPPAGLAAWINWSSLALVGVTSVSTAALQVPAHNCLSTAFAAPIHQRLCRTNWIRTFAWSARAILMLWAVGKLPQIR